MHKSSRKESKGSTTSTTKWLEFEKNEEKHLFFPNSMEKSVSYLRYFSILFEKIAFYTEILNQKVEFLLFSLISLVATGMG